MRTVAILIFSLFITLNANSALALTCKSGSAGCTQSSNTASDCTALGYTNANTANCKHYLYCPFNTAYKACVAVTDSEPEPDCSDYPLTTCPEHSICNKCPADETYKKLTGCETGYTLNSSGTGCIPATCPTGYAKTADDCYNKGSAGWSLDLTDKYDSTDCYKCTAKSCEVGYSTDVTTCEAGYEIVTKGYSGEQECKKCDKSPCSAGYSDTITSETDCSAGYSFKQDPDNPLCGMCEEKSCPDGFTAGLTDPSQCGVGGEDGWFVEFNGNESCGKCTERPCSGNANYTSVEKCGKTGATGWNYSSCYYGDELRGTCTPKSCEDHGYSTVKPDDICRTINVYLGDTQKECYYDCISCTTHTSGSSGLPYQGTDSCFEGCKYHPGSSADQEENNEPAQYTVYPITVTDDGRTGQCYGWIYTPGTDSDCCCTSEGVPTNMTECEK